MTGKALAGGQEPVNTSPVIVTSSFADVDVQPVNRQAEW